MNKNTQPKSAILAYISISRIDHWFKNIFMLPGVVAGMLVADTQLNFTLLYQLAIGVLSTCLAASANYSINEYLDAEFDKKHPKKWSRPAAQGKIKVSLLSIQYVLLAACSLLLAQQINIEFIILTVFLLIMGIVYNVSPIRTKDRAYLDILSESINNPIRFMLGWHIVTVGILAPSSILIAYWMGGAFLMTIKRFAEYRSIDNANVAGEYRKSFKYYSAEKLLIASFFFAICSSFFLAIFLIKYRIEYLICFPLLAILFAWYLKIGMQKNSATQTPEKLYREARFIVFCIFICVCFIATTAIDIPWLTTLTRPTQY